MITTYSEARDFIHSRLAFGIKPGLERMEWCLAQLRNPQRRSKYVHIAGTNGKGSVLTYLRYALQAGGYSVGTFTSPYIHTFNERISINGVPISDDEMVDLVNKVAPVAKRLEEETDFGPLTEFEAITLMMFVYFGTENPVDIVLVEVGLGGTYDSTNVISPLVSVITSIGKDHMNVLGNTIEEIAAQKAGIMKSGVATVTGVQDENLVQMFDEIAVKNRAKVYALGREFQVKNENKIVSGEAFVFNGIFAKDVPYEISMNGEHQINNAACALVVLELLQTYYGYHIEADDRKKALRNTFWPGRFEQISSNPTVILDGAHNVDGMKSLVDTINRKYPTKKKKMLLSMIANKEHKKVIEIAANNVDEIVFTDFDYPTAIKKEELLAQCQLENKQLVDDWRSYLSDYLVKKQDDEILVVAGSLYFISEVLQSKKR